MGQDLFHGSRSLVGKTTGAEGVGGEGIFAVFQHLLGKVSKGSLNAQVPEDSVGLPPSE